MPHPSRGFCERVGILISQSAIPPPRRPNNRAGNTRVLLNTTRSPAAQQLRKLAKPPVPQLRTRRHMQQPRPRPVRQRFLRNQFFRKFVMEVRDQHALDYRDSRILAICPDPRAHSPRIVSFFPEIWIVSAPTC